MSPDDATDSWRLVIDDALPAAVNMARDEALLLGGRDRATLRFYAWRPYAWSLGYFQRWKDFAAFAEAGTPIARRLTGGGAIYHADELTYSLTGPFGKGVFPRRAADIFEKVHLAIRDGLRGLGVNAELSDAPTGRSADICFEKPQKYDIVVSGAKLLGSAQRRRGGRFLQHGSLPLSPNLYAPSALSLGQLVEKRLDTATIVRALSLAFENAFEVSLVAGTLDAGEEKTAAGLAAGKYGSREWNCKR